VMPVTASSSEVVSIGSNVMLACRPGSS